MAPDYSKLTPILDQVLKPGEISSEYKAMKSATLGARIMWGLGLVGLVAGSVAACFGATTKLGVIAGAIATVAGIGAEVLVNLGYAKSRSDVKSAASSAAADIAAAQAAAPIMGPAAPAKA